MTRPTPRLVPFAVLGGLILTLAVAPDTPAQQSLPPLPPPNSVVAQQPGDANGQEPSIPEGAEVMARGPVHEAFANTGQMTTATPVVEKQPPEPIEELPPDQKPEGDNVQWMPGYWHWNDEADQFVWISGFWRSVPPGRIWVPGSWREARGGWQWAPGFWQEPHDQQPSQPEIQYLPDPPVSVESGPSIAQPANTSFYVPGSWVWRGRYVWRPGVWIDYRPGWIWVPAHFCWTPLGYVFVDGYWDYVLATRGVLYAPIVFHQPIYTAPNFYYTPMYVVSEPAMFGALFVRRGWGNYYFGDYFGANYVGGGYRPWLGVTVAGGGFAIGFGTGARWGYDPLWSYYSTAYRNDRAWFTGFNNLYDGRYRGTIAAPPRTLVQQNTVINNITNTNVKNVTNNITVVNRNVMVNKKDVTAVTMLAPNRVVKDLQPEARVQKISADVRKRQAQQARQIREVAVERKKLEVAAVAKAPKEGAKLDAPRSLKLTVPKEVVARGQVKDAKKGPPPRPDFGGKFDPKVDPRGKFDPKGKFDPDPKDPRGKFDPNDPRGKFDPKDPRGKFDPDPKDPKGKFDPKDPRGKFDPKDPRGKFDPDPKDPRGKFDPKDPRGKFDPKDPRGKFDPKDPRGKFDPKDPRGKFDPKDPRGKFDPKDPRGKFDPKDPKGKLDPPPIPRGKEDPKDRKDKDDKKDPDKDKKDTPPPPRTVRGPSVRDLPPRNNPVTEAPARPFGQRPGTARPAKQPGTQPKARVNPRPLDVKPRLNSLPGVQPRPGPVVQPKQQPPRPRVAPKQTPPREKAPDQKKQPRKKKGRE